MILVRPAFALAAALCLAAAAHAADAPPQFDPAGSDPQAVAAVDKMYAALGMPQAWEQAHYIEFGFGGVRNDTVRVNRRHCWDTWTGRYRVEGDSRRTKKHFVIQFDNVNDPKTAHVWLDGEAQTADTTVAQWAESGHGMFINDTYWLLMPYKMKDPGVHLRWQGTEVEPNSKAECSKIDVSFDNVGLTPKDHYTVWIDTAQNHVARWIYHAGEDSTTSDNMFYEYKQVGPLMLSEKRPHPGEKDGLMLVDPVVSATVNEDKFKAP